MTLLVTVRLLDWLPAPPASSGGGGGGGGGCDGQQRGAPPFSVTLSHSRRRLTIQCQQLQSQPPHAATAAAGASGTPALAHPVTLRLLLPLPVVAAPVDGTTDSCRGGGGPPPAVRGVFSAATGQLQLTCRVSGAQLAGGSGGGGLDGDWWGSAAACPHGTPLQQLQLHAADDALRRLAGPGLRASAPTLPGVGQQGAVTPEGRAALASVAAACVGALTGGGPDVGSQPWLVAHALRRDDGAAVEGHGPLGGARQLGATAAAAQPVAAAAAAAAVVAGADVPSSVAALPEERFLRTDALSMHFAAARDS